MELKCSSCCKYVATKDIKEWNITRCSLPNGPWSILGVVQHCHELYELQRGRLEAQLLQMTEERDYWSQITFCLTLKVCEPWYSRWHHCFWSLLSLWWWCAVLLNKSVMVPKSQMNWLWFWITGRETNIQMDCFNIWAALGICWRPKLPK